FSDPDPEVVARAREALESMRARGALRDPRDLVQVEDGTLRGWVKDGDVALTTPFGPVTVPWTDVVLLRPAGRQAPAIAADLLPPPAPQKDPPKGGKGMRPVVVELGNGMRLVGEIAVEGLPVLVGRGTRIAGEDLVAVTRQKGDGDPFRVLFAGSLSSRGRIDAEALTVECAGMTWRFPVREFESADFRPFRRGNPLAELIASHVRAAAAGEARPAQRFWTHIRDQPANPWDSPSRCGMTWTLLEVNGDACLVGADPATNAYQGDTPLDAELPILCIRKTGAAPPEGLDVTDPYRGWGGGEIRLSRPVRGSALTSLDEANRVIREEFGEGWRMAQHHDTSTLGWHWWAYWKER
ncbi:MAG: hypothetical protein HUU15_16515, partial [Candidatus Brocadiae bacterium]|nr:hypothetical protein [Candidatus Brocadiia bacterium]